ncbi:MAG: hypothetical protein J0I77_21990 [Rudaea sp.]|uniref:hypothetical protein n=1 Tax=unclassified Rudaea TaxID=2627037 RepID=UPI0010F89DF5|nr:MULTISPECIES: hypothetical protein [unclassified Rudaea]MBN8888399.1 hypothetical protein [Rudaea sp.]
MELDDMKLAWQTLGARLDAQNALNFHLFKESRLDKMRARLRLLSWGQAAVLAFGIVCVLCAGSFWFDHLATPHLFVAGLVMHLYGIAVIGVVARTFVLIAQIDYAAPVLSIEQQLTRLHTHYMRTGWYIGLPWLLLWVPADIVVCAWFGFDLYVNLPKLVYYGLASGLIGLIVVYATVYWIPWPASIANAVRSRSASLDGAKQFLDEIAKFEQP